MICNFDLFKNDKIIFLKNDEKKSEKKNYIGTMLRRVSEA